MQYRKRKRRSLIHAWIDVNKRVFMIQYMCCLNSDEIYWECVFCWWKWPKIHGAFNALQVKMTIISSESQTCQQVWLINNQNKWQNINHNWFLSLHFTNWSDEKLIQFKRTKMEIWIFIHTKKTQLYASKKQMEMQCNARNNSNNFTKKIRIITLHFTDHGI